MIRKYAKEIWKKKQKEHEKTLSNYSISKGVRRKDAWKKILKKDKNKTKWDFWKKNKKQLEKMEKIFLKNRLSILYLKGYTGVMSEKNILKKLKMRKI